MGDYVELELELSSYGSGQDSYSVQIARVVPGDNTDRRVDVEKPLTFDFNALLAASSDAEEYGRLLTAQLFAVPELRDEFRSARDRGKPVRFRLSISSTAPVLHSLRWETLRDPDDPKLPLLTNQNVLFSRHVFTARGMPVKPQRPENLKALVVIASPSNLDQMESELPLTPINVAEESAAAKTRLEGFEVEILASGGTATLDNIRETLTRNAYTVLYVVCHGTIVRDRPYLVLENKKGQLDTVLGLEIVQLMRDLRDPPPLIVMASCKSGGADYASTGEQVARLGSLLAVEAGIPVVVAMQGDVTIDTASTFLEKFFQQLRETGEVDWAMAFARAAVNKNSDAWMPVLYMRLLDGRLWSAGTPMLLDGAPAFGQWGAFLEHVRRGKCTPILGFGVYEEMFGTAKSLAQRWGETYRYPLSERDELPQIAQFLAVNHNLSYPQNQLENHLRREIMRLATTKGITLKEKSLDGMIVETWQKAASDRDPHRILAHIPCSLYLTTNLSCILEKALDEAGRNPQSAICQWNEDIEPKEAPPTRLDHERPTVYHLFGRFDDDNSIVVTEDNYFDYLVGTANAPKESFHKMVQGTLNSSALILLGFQITEWSLRVLFRSIMRTQGSDKRKRFTHVAVQVDPQQGGVAEPDRVYAYLAGYFKKEEITIFPGTVAQFIDQLIDKYRDAYKEDLVKKVATRIT